MLMSGSPKGVVVERDEQVDLSGRSLRITIDNNPCFPLTQKLYGLPAPECA